MSEQEVFTKVCAIIEPFVQNEQAFRDITMETSILEDLKVNSARLVDVVLEIEDAFDIEVSDEQADTVRTIGSAVHLIVEATK
jgi:acyl carrier protein